MSTMVARAVRLAAAALVMTGVIATPAHAEPGAPTELPGLGSIVDETIERQLDAGKVPGAAVSVVSGGEEVYSRGYGLADVEANTPVDPDETGFYTASVAKLFTAAAVLRLEADEKLDLNTDVNEYLDFDIPDTYPGRPVTLEHLLTHTAGFDPDYGMFGKSTDDPRELMSLRDSLIEFQPSRVEPPGTVLAYDNFGVALAGYIVQRVAKQPYDRYVNEHVYGALDMRGSTASQPHPEAVDDDLAVGYRLRGDEQVDTGGNYDPWSPTGPGQVVTAADMGRFMADQLSADSALGSHIPGKLMEQHYTQHEGMPGMGYIYEERPYNGQRVLFKGGDGSGFHNHMVLLPEHDLGIFVTVNGDGNDEADLGAVAEAVMDEYFPAPTTPKPRAVDDADVASYAGAYQSSRISHASIAKLLALGQPRVTVTVDDDGTLTTSGRTLSTREEADTQKWVPVEPGRFQEVDGPGTIAFDDGVLTESRSQNQVYLKQSWYESPELHRYLLLAALAVALLGFVALPLVALRRCRNPRGARLARLLAWLTSLGALAVTATMVTVMSDRSLMLELLTQGSPIIKAVMVAASLVCVAAAGCGVLAVVSWCRGWWRVSGRVSYSVLTAALLLFASTAYVYNLTGPPFG